MVSGRWRQETLLKLVAQVAWLIQYQNQPLPKKRDSKTPGHLKAVLWASHVPGHPHPHILSTRTSMCTHIHTQRGGKRVRETHTHRDHSFTHTHKSILGTFADFHRTHISIMADRRLDGGTGHSLETEGKIGTCEPLLDTSNKPLAIPPIGHWSEQSCDCRQEGFHTPVGTLMTHTVTDNVY